MVIQITLQSLMLFLVCSLAIIAIAMLLPILWNMKKVSGILRALLEGNQEIIKTTVKTMPGIFENVGQITSNVRDTTDKLKVSVPVIFQEVEYVTNTAKGSIELAGLVVGNVSSGINETISAYRKAAPDLIVYLRIIEEVWQIIYRAFIAKK